MCLDSVGGVLEEQCRVYRLTCNGHLKPSEMSQMLGGLREIRQSIEALPPEPAASNEAPMRTLRIVEIPSGHFFRTSEIAQNGFEITPQLTLEHQVEASPISDLSSQSELSEAPIETPMLTRAPDNARENTIDHGLHLVVSSPTQAPDPDPILQRAIAMGFEPLPRRTRRDD